MSETWITPRDFNKKWDRKTGARHVFQVRRFQGHVLEVEDVHFHHNSAVLLPDYRSVPTSPAAFEQKDRITGLAVLKACYRHAEKNPSQKLIIVGHTDTTGKGSYNLKLSQARADAVLHALRGERGEWAKIAQQRHEVEDYQQILKWVAWDKDWDCDPVEVDNLSGPKTTAAIKNFQKRYNLEADAKIPVDGIVGVKTWGAFFDIYMEELIELLETDAAGLDALRQKLRFLDGGRNRVGCGENFPIEAERKDNYRSQINRRVEILFFDPGEEPKLECHPSPGKCAPAVCEIYNPEIYRFRHIPVAPSSRGLILRIRLFDPFKEPLPDAPYRLTLGEQTREGTADKKGWLEELIEELPERCFVEWGHADEEETEEEEEIVWGNEEVKGAPPLSAEAFDEGETPAEESSPYIYELELYLNLRECEEEEKALRRLHNLGYAVGSPLDDAVKCFQRYYERPQTGSLDDVEDDLRQWHDRCEPLPLPSSESGERSA